MQRYVFIINYDGKNLLNQNLATFRLNILAFFFKKSN